MSDPPLEHYFRTYANSSSPPLNKLEAIKAPRFYQNNPLPPIDPLPYLLQKLVGTGAIAEPHYSTSYQGYSVAISSDGKTLAIGAPIYQGEIGVVFIFTRIGYRSKWQQQGAGLQARGVGTHSAQGITVSLSADGDTLAVGSPTYRGRTGAVWIYHRSQTQWSQVSETLTGEQDRDPSLYSNFGNCVALSGDGKSLAIGAPRDGIANRNNLANNAVGSTTIYALINGVWTLQVKVVGGVRDGKKSRQGLGLAFSFDGLTLAIGGLNDESSVSGVTDQSPFGEIFFFRKINKNWIEEEHEAFFAFPNYRRGRSIALSADGDTLAVGGFADSISGRQNNPGIGASWLYRRIDSRWRLQVTITIGQFGISGKVVNSEQVVQLSSDGHSLAVVGSNEVGIKTIWVYREEEKEATDQVSLVSGRASLVSGRASLVTDQTPLVRVQEQGSIMAHDKATLWVLRNTFPLSDKAVSYIKGGSLAFSGDGRTVVSGDPVYEQSIGKVLSFTTTDSEYKIWQAVEVLRGSDALPYPRQGSSVALASNGETLAVAGLRDSGNNGAVWVYRRRKNSSSVEGSEHCEEESSDNGERGKEHCEEESSDNGERSKEQALQYNNKIQCKSTNQIQNTEGIEKDWDQGEILRSKNVTYHASQGYSLALSQNGATLIVGCPTDNSGVGCIIVYQFIAGKWLEYDGKIVARDAIGLGQLGYAVSVADDGKSFVAAMPGDNYNRGSAVVFILRREKWVQSCDKLVLGDGSRSSPVYSAAMAGDGKTLVLGYGREAENAVVARVYTRTVDGANWRLADLLHGTGASQDSQEQSRVAISQDGGVIAIATPADNYGVGATWLFIRGDESVTSSADSGNYSNKVISWRQAGSKIVASGYRVKARQGSSIALSGDGDTLLIGGPGDSVSENGKEVVIGAVWIYLRVGSDWRQVDWPLRALAGKGSVGAGSGCALSLDGKVLAFGGPLDDDGVGAAWIGKIWKAVR